MLGVVLLIGTWVVLFWSESLFTESHLVGYYCCVSAGDLPPVETLARTASDFFKGWAGKYLPSLLFVCIGASVLVARMRRAGQRTWLPFLFTFLNIVYLVLGFWLMSMSWAISDWVVGPLTSAYKGYDRTWYGIVAHLLLWVVLFFALARTNPGATRGAKAQIIE
jgi:hypothetical protein